VVVVEPGPDTVVRVADLHVVRGGNEVVRGVEFEVAAGEVTGLLGPSGCGKTTLMRAVVGVQANVSGTCEVLGLPAGSEQLRHSVGYLTQAPAVYRDLTVRENVAYFATVLGVGRPDVERVLDAVDLQSLADHRTSRLSGGQLGRVSLATALLGRPRLLVLDEPTVGLDPVLRRDLWDMFRALAGDGAALLVSSHVMDEATRCDRLLLMRDGLLVADDTEAGLIARTGASDVEGAFLAIVEGSDASSDSGSAP
jgi:ABC-2 type transport system ATP-binding protein